MDLTHQLANALQQAIINADRGFKPGPELEHWNSLIKKVQDLDSVFYLAAKCKAAGCQDGTHVCGQGEIYDRIAKEAVHEI